MLVVAMARKANFRARGNEMRGAGSSHKNPKKNEGRFSTNFLNFLPHVKIVFSVNINFSEWPGGCSGCSSGFVSVLLDQRFPKTEE